MKKSEARSQKSEARSQKPEETTVLTAVADPSGLQATLDIDEEWIYKVLNDHSPFNPSDCRVAARSLMREMLVKLVRIRLTAMKAAL